MTILLDRWLGLADRISRYAIWFGGTLVLVSAFVVSVDVLLRKIFLISMGGSDELSGYAFAIGTAWALGFTLLRRANVRRSEEHTSELPSLMRISYAVSCLKKKQKTTSRT